jgi:AAA15 family ATPase/GTPase
LDEGTIDSIDNHNLLVCENLLNLFFTKLYSDIKRVFYKFEKNNIEYSYKLFSKKMINGHLIDVPFSSESTGTRHLLDIFPMFLNCICGMCVYIDEFDNGIHDLLINNIINAISKEIRGQLIITTHNTMLMEQVTPNDAYIISSDVSGNKSIYCIAEFGNRTQVSNNMRRKYLKGDYEGIPYISDIDFGELRYDFCVNADFESKGC